MLAKLLTSSALILASVSAPALAASNAGAATPVLAQANMPMFYSQCVKNVFGTGIVAKVRWYDPTTVIYTPGTKVDDLNTAIDERIGDIKPKPFMPKPREENIAVGQTSCNAGMTGQQMPKLALVSVYGGGIVNEAISISVATVVGVVGGVACVTATAGSACPAVAATAAAIATGTVSLVSMGIPDAKDVFYAGTPGMLEISGAAWNPVAKDKTLGVANLPYVARIDFCNTAYKDTATANKITVDFMSRGQLVHSGSVNGNVSDCGAVSKGYVEVAGSTAAVVDQVVVRTDGGDAMLIDQVEVWRDGTKFIWDGRQNGGGWCLSTDPNDHIGGWEAIGSCSKQLAFRNPA